MTDSSNCAHSNPARPLFGLLLRSLPIRRCAAATRSRARSRSATVYCRGPGRVRFLCGPFAALLARMAALRPSRAKPTREFPRLCRGGSKSLTYPEVGSLGPWTGLQTVSHQAHERSPANGVATRSKATRLQMDGLPESEVRMSEKHTRFLGRHCAMRVGMRIDAARTSRFERLQS
jgi:hypothetical protein